MTFRTVFLAALIGAVSFGAVASAQAAPLRSAGVTKLFPGQFEAQVKGYRVIFSGTRDGALTGVAYGQQDEGRWFMKGSALCVSWNKWTKGKTHCGEISQQGGWYVASGSEGEMLKFRRTDLAQND